LIRPRSINRGARVYVFCTNPGIDYRLSQEDDDRFTSGYLIREKVPKNAVFTVLVDYDLNRYDAILDQMGYTDISGVVVSWEWTLADSQTPSLPANYGERFEKLVWSE
jgi:hypothetical protein